jgi:hypothetical protein
MKNIPTAAPGAPEVSTPPRDEEIIPPDDFANPRLKPIIASARLKQTHNWADSIALEILAWLVVPLGAPAFAVIFFAGKFTPLSFLGPLWAVVAFGAAFHVTASVFYRLRRAAQRRRVNALSDLRKDGRDPVLYLRSFYVDATKDAERLDQKTDEEVLTLALREVGPVLAIGIPKRAAAPGPGDAGETTLLGATRIYFADADWQKAVSDLMGVARLVVITAGASEGLLWEIRAAVREAGHAKLLISFLPWQSLDSRSRHARYEVFRRLAEPIFREALRGDDGARAEGFSFPPTLGGASFFFFGEDWKVEPVRIGKWRRRFYFMSLPTLMRETLRPALRERGAEPRRWKSNVYLFLAIYVLASPFLWFVLGVAGALLHPFSERLAMTVAAVIFSLAVPANLLAVFVLGLLIRNWLASSLRRRRQVIYTELDISGA